MRRPAADRKPRRAAVPVLMSQVEAASRLHAATTQWVTTDRAFRLLADRLPGFSREACLVKAAAINDLYSTNVFAIWRMADHLHRVMTCDPPQDPVELVAAIATLPATDASKAPRKHWSFASKLAHFFLDGERCPLYDSYCRDMIAYHLGAAETESDAANPYRVFKGNLEKLVALSALSCTLRRLDRYLWLTGQYRAWLQNPAEATVNSELRSLFESPSAETQADLHALWPHQ